MFFFEVFLDFFHYIFGKSLTKKKKTKIHTQTPTQTQKENKTKASVMKSTADNDSTKDI